MEAWLWVGFAGLLVWAGASVWLVHRLNRGEQPHVDPYDWQ